MVKGPDHLYRVRGNGKRLDVKQATSYFGLFSLKTDIVRSRYNADPEVLTIDLFSGRAGVALDFGERD